MNQYLTLDQVRAAAPAAFTPIASPEMSDRYSHVTTAKILDALQQDGWKITAADQRRSRVPGFAEHNVHRISLTHSELPTHAEGAPQMLLGNSGNGTSAVRVMGGFLRMACLNQNYVGVKVVGGVFHHRGASLEDRIVAGARELRANFDKVIRKFELWSQIELSLEQQAELARASLPLRWPSAEIIGIANFGAIRRQDDVGRSLWKTYQRTQESLIRGGFTATFVERSESGTLLNTHTRTVRKITGLTASERINTGLWNLADTFATNLS